MPPSIVRAAIRAAGCTFAFALTLATLASLPASAADASPMSGQGKRAPTAVELCDPAELAAAFAKQPASTKKMAALLDQIRRDADPMRNPFRSSEHISQLTAQLAQNTNVEREIEIRMMLAQDYLSAGQSREALRENETLLRIMRDKGVVLDARMVPQLYTAMAICQLRIGEQENCAMNHNAESCLFPIQGGGIHQLTEGSRGAVKNLTELLQQHPGDLRARWLLNIAYMTLGEYPDKVPPRLLIPPKHFQSDYNLTRFPDVAAAVGLDLADLAGGVVLEDFDHDGFLDLMCSAWGLTDQLRVFRNNGDGTFTERTIPAGLVGLVGGLNMIHGDYNNDGFADVLVLRGGWLRSEGNYPNSLLRNNGDFTFTDVTEEAGMISFHPTQTAAWFDFNGDGLLDIFVGNESDGRNVHPCELYRNNGDGTFTECAGANGVDFVGFYKGVVSGDYNNDGRPDLYLSRRDGPKILLRNDGPMKSGDGPRGPWKFTNVTEAAGVPGPVSSFPCWFWDYNNDGWLDIMVTGYEITDVGDIAADFLGRPHTGQKAKLYRNNGDGTFADVSREVGVNKLLHTMGCNYGDLDNDGWLDFYAGTGDPDYTTLIPSRMFRNDGGVKFQDVTTAGGFGQLQKGHGIAFGDIDNDGDQDIYSSVGGAVEGDWYHNQLFLNPGHGHRWLKLQLEGTKSNRVAIGARIQVDIEEANRVRSIHRTVGTGASFGSSPLRQEIGLGDATKITRVIIRWPTSGETQEITGLELDHTYAIREGSTTATTVALRSFVMPMFPAGNAAPHQHSPTAAMKTP